jgi:hypothetical protein
VPLQPQALVLHSIHASVALGTQALQSIDAKLAWLIDRLERAEPRGHDHKAHPESYISEINTSDKRGTGT